MLLVLPALLLLLLQAQVKTLTSQLNWLAAAAAARQPGYTAATPGAFTPTGDHAATSSATAADAAAAAAGKCLDP